LLRQPLTLAAAITSTAPLAGTVSFQPVLSLLIDAIADITATAAFSQDT